MQKICKMKLKSLILCMMLIVAMAFGTVGCGNKTDVETQKTEETAKPEESNSEVTVLGEGKTKFDFTVVDAEGKETKFEINTDKETVGAALLDLKLIAGDKAEYGLYVKTVNGITADYDKDGAYWAFYVNGEYASTGVDSTKITAGDSYSFKVEKQ